MQTLTLAVPYLTARELVALAHVCAHARNIVGQQLAPTIAARFPGRTRCGDDLDAASRIPDWRFLVLLEDRGDRARIVALDVGDTYGYIGDIYRVINSRWRELLLRGDLIKCDQYFWCYWTGDYFTSPQRNYSDIPTCFAVPREFAPEYFAFRGCAIIRVELDMRQMTKNIVDAPRKPHEFQALLSSFVENGRTFNVMLMNLTREQIAFNTQSECKCIFAWHYSDSVFRYHSIDFGVITMQYPSSILKLEDQDIIMRVCAPSDQQHPPQPRPW